MTTNEPEVIEVDQEAGRKLFDDASQRLLAITGDEFLRRWDSGKYRADTSLAVVKVAMLIPFARR